MSEKMTALMPHFTRHAGRWVGTYTHQTPSGERIDQYEVHILAEFPDDGTCDFRLTTHNVWPDGRESDGVYTAEFRDGRLWWTGDLVGAMWEIDEFTTYLRFGFRADPSIDVCEMLQISDDGQHRARTWHWFRDQKLFQVTLTDERRVA